MSETTDTVVIAGKATLDASQMMSELDALRKVALASVGESLSSLGVNTAVRATPVPGVPIPPVPVASSNSAASANMVPLAPTPVGWSPMNVGTTMAGSGAPGQNTGNNANGTVINASTVIINATNANTTTGAGSNTSGGNGGGNTAPGAPNAPIPAGSGKSGGGSGSGSGGSGSGGGGLNAPEPENAGGGGFFRNLLSNPTPSGIFNTAMHSLPLESMGLLGAAGYGMSMYGQIAVAGQRATFENETSLEASRMAGRFVDRATEAALTAASVKQAALDEDRAKWSMLTGLPIIGSAINSNKTLADWQDQEREIAVMRASAENKRMRRSIGALAGRSTLDDGENEFLGGMYSLRHSASVFGPMAVGDLPLLRPNKQAAKGFEESDWLGAISTVMRIGGDPRHQGMYSSLATQGLSNRSALLDPDLIKQAGYHLAGQGDLAGVTSLQSYLDPSEYKTLLSTARGQQVRGANIRKAQTLYGLRSNEGADFGELSSLISSQEEDIARNKANLLAMRDRVPADRRGDFDQELLDLDVSAQQSKRQRNQLRYGLAVAGAGVTSSEASYMSTGARLFGGPQSEAAATAKEGEAIATRLQAIAELLKSGLLSQEEQKRYQAESNALQARSIENTESMIRNRVHAEYGVASAGVGLLSTERGTAFSRGTGGVEGLGLSLGVLDQSREAARRAAVVVETLRRRGVSPDNPEFIQARQTQAQAEAQVSSTELSLADSPTSIGLRREQSRNRFTIDTLSALPGSMGNLRGAYRKQIETTDAMIKEVQAEYAKVADSYGGVDKVPAAVSERFENRLFSLGRESEQNYLALSQGWESRLVSQTLGNPGGGSFSMIANHFSLKDAVGKNIFNPHMGSTISDLPLFLQMSAGEFPGMSNIAGATGTPLGFARTALTGTTPKNTGMAGLPEDAALPSVYRGAVGMPEYALPGRTMSVPGTVGAGAAGGDGKIHIQIDITQDGKIIRTEQRRITPTPYNVYSEDIANFISKTMRGQ